MKSYLPGATERTRSDITLGGANRHNPFEYILQKHMPKYMRKWIRVFIAALFVTPRNRRWGKMFNNRRMVKYILFCSF